MPQLVIEGGKTLGGSIPVYGSKNAALPLLAAGLLTEAQVQLSNMPPIADVLRMIEILQTMGVSVEQDGTDVTLAATEVQADNIPTDLVRMLRGSILLLGALLGRQRHARVPTPGGDIIGARPVDVHLDGFMQLGARIVEDADVIEIDGKNMKPGRVVLREFSVTATENMMLAAASLPGKTTIEIAAAEPHVKILGALLSSMGAKVAGAGTHTITVEGVDNLAQGSVRNIPDMLEAGLFILLGAATQSEISVGDVPVDDLLLFFKKLDDIGITYAIEGKVVHVQPSKMRSFRIQTLPHPGIATDLQAPFSVIATQVTGSSMIHDPMYEGRFKYVAELQKMGANAIVADPHRVIITGPTPLTGKQIPSLDIRAGATLLMAGLVAEGETIIDGAEIIDRGYAELTERLQALGARITRR